MTKGQLSANDYNLPLLVSLIPTEGVVDTSIELRAWRSFSLVVDMSQNAV